MISNKRMSEMYMLNKSLGASVMFGCSDFEDYLEKNDLSVEAQLSVVTFDITYIKHIRNIHEDTLCFVNYAVRRLCKENSLWRMMFPLFCNNGDYMENLYPDTQKMVRDHLMNNVEAIKEIEDSTKKSFGGDFSRTDSIRLIVNNVFDNDEDRVKFMLLIS